MTEPELFHYELKDTIALLTMDDGKANALSSDMMNQLDRALTKAQAEAKAVVLAGRPGRFCGGFDLKVMMSGPQQARTLVSQGSTLLMRIYEYPLPFVSACTGHAVAGGALLLLSSDTRLGATGDFKLGLNEVAIGMTVPILAQELARDRLAAPALTAAVLQSQLYNPEQAVSVGYLDQVVAADSLLQSAIAAAQALAKLPAAAFAATKRRLRRATIEHVRETLEVDLAQLTNPG